MHNWILIILHVYLLMTITRNMFKGAYNLNFIRELHNINPVLHINIHTIRYQYSSLLNSLNNKEITRIQLNINCHSTFFCIHKFNLINLRKLWGYLFFNRVLNVAKIIFNTHLVDVLTFQPVNVVIT